MVKIARAEKNGESRGHLPQCAVRIRQMGGGNALISNQGRGDGCVRAECPFRPRAPWRFDARPFNSRPSVAVTVVTRMRGFGSDACRGESAREGIRWRGSEWASLQVWMVGSQRRSVDDGGNGTARRSNAIVPVAMAMVHAPLPRNDR